MHPVMYITVTLTVTVTVVVVVVVIVLLVYSLPTDNLATICSHHLKRFALELPHVL